MDDRGRGKLAAFVAFIAVDQETVWREWDRRFNIADDERRRSQTRSHRSGTAVWCEEVMVPYPFTSMWTKRILFSIESQQNGQESFVIGTFSTVHWSSSSLDFAFPSHQHVREIDLQTSERRKKKDLRQPSLCIGQRYLDFVHHGGGTQSSTECEKVTSLARCQPFDVDSVVIRRYPPLPDLFLDNIPYIGKIDDEAKVLKTRLSCSSDWAFMASECIIVIMGMTFLLVVVFHKYWWVDSLILKCFRSKNLI